MKPYISRNFGKIITETPYNAEWVNAIKTVIPGAARTYLNNGMWSISPQYYAAVIEITKHMFGGSIIDDVGGVKEPQDSSWKERWESFKVHGSSKPWDARESEEKKPYRPRKVNTTAYATLFVTQDAPAEVIKASYRVLSQKYHPDKDGGDVDIMAGINAAYEELKKAGRVS